MSDWTKGRDVFTHYVLPIAAGVGTGILTANPAVGVGVGGALLSAGQADFAQKAQAAANNTNWQHQKELTSLAYQHDLQMADYNNEWNSYANQAKLMRSAGLNPAVMFGEGSLASGSHAGASSIPTPTPMQSLYDSDLINAQNNMVSNLINAGIQVAKTPKELDKMDAQIQDLLSSAKNKDAATAYQELQTQLDQTFSSFERQKGLDKIAADIKYTLAKEMLTLKQGELVDEQKVNTWMDTILKRSQKLLNEQNYKMLVEQAPVILQNLIKTGKQIEATTSNINTSTAWIPYNAVTGRISANASSVAAAAQAEDLRATRAARINSINADAREKNSLSAINEYELDTRPSKMIASWHNFVDMVTSTVSATTSVSYLSKELELIGQEIEAAKKHNDWYLVNQLMDNAKDIAISIGSVAIARKNFGTTGKATPVGFKNYK